jgi:hypothetical protein
VSRRDFLAVRCSLVISFSVKMIHVPDAFPTGIDDATPSGPAHLRELYSPECVE